MKRLLALALLLAAFACAPARADDNCLPVPAERTPNADGSWVSVATVCDTPGMRSYVMLAARKGGEPRELRVDVETEYAPTGSARVVDIDHDGQHEIEVRGMCGAGPNCEGELYRVDASGKLALFFSGGYSDLSVIDGYLVEAGRASCCSWEYHAYRMSGDGWPLDYDRMDFMVEVGADLDSDAADVPIRCTFSRSRDGKREVIAPPARTWLPLCDLYGDYHLTTPAEARAAAARDTQE